MVKIMLFACGLYWFDYDPMHRETDRYAEGVQCECPKQHQGAIEVGDTVYVNPQIGSVFCARIVEIKKP